VPTSPQPASEELVDGATNYVVRFGSAHAVGCNFVFCDGSVHTMSYDIDAEIVRRLCNRCDGLTVPGDY
jgi:prepilin-type processing-associated H-X9-DG protein